MLIMQNIKRKQGFLITLNVKDPMMPHLTRGLKSEKGKRKNNPIWSLPCFLGIRESTEGELVGEIWNMLVYLFEL